MTINGNLERFQYVHFETDFLQNEDLLQKSKVLLSGKIGFPNRKMYHSLLVKRPSNQ